MNEIMTSLETLTSLQSNKIEDVGFFVFLVLLVTSAVSSYVVSLFYLSFYGGNSTGSQIHRAFPLLGISITAIFVSIQFSLPLSLGLLGALSIVRFRTPIKEPEEIGFIMLVVALSISCAIFNFQFVLLLLVVSLAVLIYLKLIGFPVQPASRNALIVITLPASAEQPGIGTLTDYIAAMVKTYQLESLSEDTDGGRVVSYRVGGTKNLDADKLIGFVKTIHPDGIAELYLNHS